ncbi:MULTISPECIES: SLBB domain-containing protein [unclassified Candidatus Frackibacter]|uniref:SLBB domain-containing protein n=1 Tax=unclassified Candidatus Frackibacter TaxID=2648818 RepID=UPI0015A3AC04|nr:MULTISPECIES: SLBB domain-containing protein [unclassified Candidatus Frackibacter]
MRRVSLVLGILILMVLINSVGIWANDYKLSVDDQLFISVWGHPDLQRQTVVGPDGKINFPLVGEIKAIGLTVKELTKVLDTRLRQYIKLQEAQVNVALEKYQRFRVTVLGEVNRPGTYQLQKGKRILDAISFAGGVNQLADLAHVKLTRNNKSLLIELESLLNGDNTLQNYKLEDGDVLYIPEDTIEVTVLGEVRKAGKYKLKRGVHLSDLIAQAGGLTDRASNKAKYISGKRTESLELAKIFNKKSNNPNLKNGDTVYIPKTKYDWQRFFFFVGGLNSLKDLLN